MKDLTVFESSASPDFVRVIFNTARCWSRLNQFDVPCGDTVHEVQTIEGLNYRSFESVCWKAGLTVQDSRY